MACPDPECNGARPGTFMPYAQTRALIAPHWPKLPSSGQRLELTPRGDLNAALDAGAGGALIGLGLEAHGTWRQR